MGSPKRKRRKTVGRPTVMTDEVLEKLRQAYLWGATDQEACSFAGIGRTTLFEYKTQHPTFQNKIESWKDDPILRAKKKVSNDIDKNTDTAKWYLERKKKDEFSPRSEVTGVDGNAITLLLDRKESDYDEIAKRAAKQIGSETSGQVVEVDAPIQDQGQERETDNIQSESDSAEVHGGEGQPSP